MGFKISSSPKFWATVSLQMVGEDGRKLTGDIKVQYSRLTPEAYQEYLERNAQVPLSKSLMEVVHDWKGAEDDNGVVAFTPENFERWCNAVPGSYMAIGAKFARVHNGIDIIEAMEVRKGN